MNITFGQAFGGGGGESLYRRIECFQSSTTITMAGSGPIVLRAMGAGGGGARGYNARGGNGGTVATKAVTVSAGDVLVITIPAGGAGKASSDGNGAAGGNLTVVRSGVTLLSIPGGRGGLNTTAAPTNNTAPTGADWYVLGGLAGNGDQSGGGGAMIVKGGTVAGRGGNGSGSGGGGARGNASDASPWYGGGSLEHSTISRCGGGFILPETSVLLFAIPMPSSGILSGSYWVPGATAFGGGDFNTTVGFGSDGGFGGGGSGGNSSRRGGFAGGGGGNGVNDPGGDGGFGGGGSGAANANAGNGGQGWLTIEFLGGAAA